MGFFNNLGKKTTEVTNKITNEAKLKIRINDNKGKVKNLYEEIGKKVYEAHLREEDINIEEIKKDECSKIDELAKEIEEAGKKILELNHKKTCSKCFAEIEEDAQFCPKCGEKQNDNKAIFEEAEEKLENSEISSDNKEEAKDVKEQLDEKND